VDRIIGKFLEKDRNLRYQHASEVRTDLQRFRRDTTLSVRPASETAIAKYRKVTIPAAALVLLAADYFYFHRALHSTPKLTDKDTIVLADFENKTSDPVFDGTLRQGLAVQLEQSPFLKIMEDQEMQRDLRLMGAPPGGRITNPVAHEAADGGHSSIPHANVPRASEGVSGRSIPVGPGAVVCRWQRVTPRGALYITPVV